MNIKNIEDINSNFVCKMLNIWVKDREQYYSIIDTIKIIIGLHLETTILTQYFDHITNNKISIVGNSTLTKLVEKELDIDLEITI